MLRQLEQEMDEEEIPIYERLRFEIEMCGAPFTTCESRRGEYAVLEVDDRYSPKLRLYNIATGRVGIMKLKKAIFKAQPLEMGSIIHLLSWDRKPAYRFYDGKAHADHERIELWITQYKKIC